MGMNGNLDKFLENVSGIDVSQNEIMYTYQFNRNFLKLLRNDIKLDQVAQQVLGSFKIKQWVSGTVYAYGDLVWYDGPNGDSLYLLRCSEQANDKTPAIVMVDGKVDNDALN